MTETVALSLGIEIGYEERWKRIVLHYNLKVSIVSGKLTGAEALIR